MTQANTSCNQKKKDLFNYYLQKHLLKQKIKNQREDEERKDK
jgi:hypothetical protein